MKHRTRFKKTIALCSAFALVFSMGFSVLAEPAEHTQTSLLPVSESVPPQSSELPNENSALSQTESTEEAFSASLAESAPLAESASADSSAPQSASVQAPEILEPNSTPTTETQSESSPVSSLPASSAATKASEPKSAPFDWDSNLQNMAKAQVDAKAALTLLDPNTALVTTYAELKTALSENNGITTVYFANNITGEASGIRIHNSKPSVVIDAHPPGAAEGVNYTYTQYDIASLDYSIYVEAANTVTKSITVRNITVVGANYAGMIHAREALSGVTITYENMVYTGPQVANNRSGTVRFLNCDVTLKASRSSVIEELAEASQVELGGVFTLQTTGTANSIIWLSNYNTALRVLDNANVNITTSHYFIYADAAYPDILFGTNSVFKLINKNGFTYAAQSVGTVTLAPGADVFISQDSTLTYAALYITKTLTAQEGSSLEIRRYGAVGFPLYFTVTGSKATFNNPKRVALYTSGQTLIRFLAAGSLSITTATLNLWQTAALPTADTITNLPTHIWNDQSSTLFTLNATYYDLANQTFAHTLSANAPITTPLTNANFTLEKAHMLTFGSMPLTIRPLTNASTAITGGTNAGAQVRATYTPLGGTQKQADGVAGTDRLYSIPLGSDRLVVGNPVAVLASDNYLKVRQNTTVLDSSGYRLAFLRVPSTLTFGGITLPETPTIVRRQDAFFSLSVGDTRLTPSPWRVDASIDSPLTQVDDATHTLPNAMVFVDTNKNMRTLNASPSTIYTQNDAHTGEFAISWAADEGILLNVTPGAVYSGSPYTTNIHWDLVDAP